MEPYRIHCTTCKARLRVTDPELIGQILACPKCRSMVLVTPPPQIQPNTPVAGIVPGDRVEPADARPVVPQSAGGAHAWASSRPVDLGLDLEAEHRVASVSLSSENQGSADNQLSAANQAAAANQLNAANQAAAASPDDVVPSLDDVPELKTLGQAEATLLHGEGAATAGSELTSRLFEVDSDFFGSTSPASSWRHAAVAESPNSSEDPGASASLNASELLNASESLNASERLSGSPSTLGHEGLSASGGVPAAWDLEADELAVEAGVDNREEAARMDVADHEHGDADIAEAASAAQEIIASTLFPPIPGTASDVSPQDARAGLALPWSLDPASGAAAKDSVEQGGLAGVDLPAELTDLAAFPPLSQPGEVDWQTLSLPTPSALDIAPAPRWKNYVIWAAGAVGGVSLAWVVGDYAWERRHERLHPPAERIVSQADETHQAFKPPIPEIGQPHEQPESASSAERSAATDAETPALTPAADATQPDTSSAVAETAPAATPTAEGQSDPVRVAAADTPAVTENSDPNQQSTGDQSDADKPAADNSAADNSAADNSAADKGLAASPETQVAESPAPESPATDASAAVTASKDGAAAAGTTQNAGLGPGWAVPNYASLFSESRFLPESTSPGGVTSDPKDVGSADAAEPAAAAAAAASDTRTVERPDEPYQIVDVESKLKEKMASLQLAAMPLNQVLDLLSTLSGVPIAVDPDALILAGCSPRRQVTFKSTGEPFEQVLKQVLQPLKLSHVVRNGCVWVTVTARTPDLPEIRYPLDDLVAEGANPAAWADLIQRMIEPPTWAAQGGNGACSVSDQGLTIQQAPLVHFQTMRLLDTLRVARGLKPRSRFPKQLFDTAWRSRLASTRWNKPLRMDAWVSQPLSELWGQVERRSGVTVLVDWPSLVEQGWSPQAKVTWGGSASSVAEGVDAFCDRHDWVAVRCPSGILWVTTRETAAELARTEFHRVAQLTHSDGLQVWEAFRAQLPVELSDFPAEVSWEAQGNVLMVHANELLQRQLASYLQAQAKAHEEVSTRATDAKTQVEAATAARP